MLGARVKFHFVILSMISGCLLAGQAQAITINVTVNGIVSDVQSYNSSVFDNIEVGDTFTAKYKFDLNTATYISYYDSAGGGMANGGGPFGSVKLQIGSQSFSFIGNYSSHITDYGTILWQD